MERPELNYEFLWQELEKGNVEGVKATLAEYSEYFMADYVQAAVLGMQDASKNLARTPEYFLDKTPKGAAYRKEYNRYQDHHHPVEREPVFGLLHRPRKYRCQCCAWEMDIGTNHTGTCSAICPGCSWMPSFGKGHRIPALGSRTYRTFEYIGPKSGEDEVNPHAKQS